MPTYNFQNRDTDAIKSVFCTYAEALTMVETGEWKLCLSAPATVSGVGTVVGKIDGGFNDLLKTIHKNNRHSKIQTR